MTKIYDQHDKAFEQVQAFVVCDTDDTGLPVKLATIAFKFPRDGAGRLYAYVHWIGVPMVRGYANGYGYDKRSAAVESAAALIAGPDDKHFEAFRAALTNIGGNNWDRALQDAGFTVFQAV